MKKTSKTMKISVITAVGALALFGGAFVSTASADSTATPTPTVSPAPTTNPFDAQLNDEADAQTLIGDNQEEQDLLSAVATIDLTDEATVDENADVQEIDNGVDEIDADNNQVTDSFNQDITEAEQTGEHEDAVQLGVDAAIVTSVTVPEAHAMAADDNEAHGLLTGSVQK